MSQLTIIGLAARAISNGKLDSSILGYWNHNYVYTDNNPNAGSDRFGLTTILQKIIEIIAGEAADKEKGKSLSSLLGAACVANRCAGGGGPLDWQTAWADCAHILNELTKGNPELYGALQTIVGIEPLVGDCADFCSKATKKNGFKEKCSGLACASTKNGSG